MTWAVTLGDRVYEVRIVDGGGDGRFFMELVDGDLDGEREVTLDHVHGRQYLLTLENRSFPLFIDRWNGNYRIVLYGHQFSAQVEDAELHRLREEVAGLHGVSGPSDVVAPMPGLVLRVEVEEGDRIERGQGVVVIESMKMENEIRAGTGGIVGKIVVEPGMVVDKGERLVELTPAD